MNRNNREKVVVFGGSGFLGSHTADELTQRGFDVLIYDKKRSPYLKENQEMIIGDILDEDKIYDTLRNTKYVYNFSGLADIEECHKESLKAIKYNILGGSIILENCKRQKVGRIIFASSVYVYSKHGSFYRITKQCCEQLTEEYYEKFNLPFTILRYGSLYGPRFQAWNGVSKFIYQALTKNQIDYPGTGQEKREYIHILDAAKLSVDILSDGYVNKCIIITGNHTMTSKDLLHMISEMLGNKVKINLTDETIVDHYQTTPYSFTPKIGLKLTPSPSIDLGEGILQQIDDIYKQIQK